MYNRFLGNTCKTMTNPNSYSHYSSYELARAISILTCTQISIHIQIEPIPIRYIEESDKILLIISMKVKYVVKDTIES